MNLIVGATGMLGGELCRLFAAQGRRVRALTRASSDPAKVEGLKRAGIEIVGGDLKDRPSLEAACRGATLVVSTASSTIAREQHDSIESVDHQGQCDLVEIAERAGVRRFILISFPNVDVDFPLQTAKRAVEQRLRSGRMSYTILQPTFFMEIWLSPALGFDVEHATARIYGAGQNRISWISFRDVAKFAAASADSTQVVNATVKLGGPEALSPLEVVRLAEEATGRSFTVDHVPEEALRAQHAAAADPLQRSFAALMLYYARGDVIEMTETLSRLPVLPLKSVCEHLGAVA